MALNFALESLQGIETVVTSFRRRAGFSKAIEDHAKTSTWGLDLLSKSVGGGITMTCKLRIALGAFVALAFQTNQAFADRITGVTATTDMGSGFAEAGFN